MEKLDKTDELSIAEDWEKNTFKELDDYVCPTKFTLPSLNCKPSVFSMTTLTQKHDKNNQVNDLPSTQVIMAALNEEEGVQATIKEFSQYLRPSQIIVADGKSSDNTVEVAQKLGAKTVFQDGKGKGDAFAKAIQYLQPETEYVIITDADFTYPADTIPEMIKILNENPNIGMVCGNRFGNKINSPNQSDLFFFGNRFLAFVHNILNGIHLTDPLTGLRVVRADLLRNWDVRSKGFDMEVELNHHVEREKFGIVEVPITYRERVGEKKLKVRHGLSILKRIFIEYTR
ncbi:MAG: glycosyltransferase family 2 protein [Candidatus Bathyarchaeota archaeon]|nr:glycosyltransferase family 2 protein [Candidatus Bathyarchaeota archaeon]